MTQIGAEATSGLCAHSIELALLAQNGRYPAYEASSAPLTADCLLILSPFDSKHRRITAEAAQYRSRSAADLADRILIPYAAPGRNTEAFATEVEGWGKCVTADAGALAGSLA